MVNEVLKGLLYFLITGHTIGYTKCTIYYYTDSQLLDSAYLVPDKAMPDQSVYKLYWAKTYSTR